VSLPKSLVHVTAFVLALMRYDRTTASMLAAVPQSPTLPWVR
jgi:hypothetical protein